MRARRLALLAACAAVALAGCASEDVQKEEAAAPAAVESEAATSPRTVDPDAPANAVLAESDDMGHKMCELWTTALADEGDLRDTADDVAWYGTQADNDFMRSPVNTQGWGPDNAGQTTILCGWNGYEAEDGSPADMLG